MKLSQMYKVAFVAIILLLIILRCWQACINICFNKNDKWIELPAVSIRGFSSELLGIARASNGITPIKINWKDRYGTLKSGKYKLVVPVSYCEKIGDYDYKFEDGEVAIDFEI